MLNITSGIVPRAQRVVLYGVEGIGKTTLASQAPDPLFIDTENGSTHMDVKRIQRPGSWEELIATVQEVARTPGCCKTLVLDTADWAEAMTITHICQKYKQPGLEAFGYGKGYTYLSEEFARLLAAFDQVIESGRHVIVTAHARQRKVELPDETGSFDVWGLKLTKQCAPLLKEWADALLFMNYKTYVVTTENKVKKAQGGKRVIYTTHCPVWDAKNRHGLAEELPMEWASIAGIFGGAAPVAPAPAAPAAPVAPAAPAPEPPRATEVPGMEKATAKTMEALKKRAEVAGIPPKAIQKLVGNKGKFPAEMPIYQYPDAFITGWIFPNWEQIVQTIISDPEYLPF